MQFSSCRQLNTLVNIIILKYVKLCTIGKEEDFPIHYSMLCDFYVDMKNIMKYLFSGFYEFVLCSDLKLILLRLKVQ